MTGPDRAITTGGMLILGMILGAFAAHPACGAELPPLEQAEALLVEAASLNDEAKVFANKPGGNAAAGALILEAEALLVEAEALVAEVISERVAAAGPTGLSAPTQTTQEIMDGPEAPHDPTPGGRTVPLSEPPPSLGGFDIQGVIVLEEPVEDLSGPSNYKTPAGQWDDLPWIVKAALFLSLWSLVASLVMLVGAGSGAVEARLRRWASKVTPDREVW